MFGRTRPYNKKEKELRKMFSYSVTQVAQKKKIEYTPNKSWTCNTTLGVTSPDALPPSHRRLVEPKATIKTMFFPALH